MYSKLKEASMKVKVLVLSVVVGLLGAGAAAALNRLDTLSRGHAVNQYQDATIALGAFTAIVALGIVLAGMIWAAED